MLKKKINMKEYFYLNLNFIDDFSEDRNYYWVQNIW